MRKLVTLLTITVAAAGLVLAAVDHARADAASKDAAKTSTAQSRHTKQKPMLNPQPLPPGVHAGSTGGGAGKIK